MCNWLPRKWPWLQLSSSFIDGSDEGADCLCSHLTLSTVYSTLLSESYVIQHAMHGKEQMKINKRK